jgi:hypothetical protein
MMRVDDRLDRFASELSKLKASDGASRAASLDLWFSELQREVRDLQREVSELKAKR